MSASGLLGLSIRELRRSYGKLVVPGLCIAVAVASQSAVGFFSAQVNHAMDQEAKAMAGADLEISSARDLSQAELTRARSALPANGVRTTEVLEFISMAANPLDGRTRLVEVRSVGDGFPFYGNLETDPPLPLARLVIPTTGSKYPGIFVQPEILPQLGVDRGERIKLGNQEFTVLTWVKKEPGPGGAAFSLGPKVWIHQGDLAKTGLAQIGSRVRHRRLFALSPEPTPSELEKLKKSLETSLADTTLRVRTYQESNSQLRSFYQRLDEFLSLLTLLVFLLAGVGVMSAIRAHIRTRVPSIAVLRCFGATRGQVFGMFLFQALCLGLVGSAVGTGAGALLSRLIPVLLSGIIELPPQNGIAWGPSLSGLLSGVAVTLLFSLVSLVELPSIRPALLLRSQPHSPTPTLAGLLAGVAVFVYFAAQASWQTRSVADGVRIVGGVACIGALLYGGFYFLIRALDRAPRLIQRLPFSIRYGLKNFFRLRGQAALTLSVLGLGVLLLSTVSLLRIGMLSELSGISNPARPELFLIDVGDDQKAELTRELDKAGGDSIHWRLNWAKLIKTRLMSVNGEIPTRDADNESRSREFNLSERLNLYDTERIREGAFWSGPVLPIAARATPATGIVASEIDASVETDFAERMRVKLGDRLDFEIQGVPFTARIRSLREVKWATFEPNFFILLRPGALDGAPFTWIGTLAGAGTPTLKSRVQETIVRHFPTVTVIDVEEASLRLLRIANRIEAVIRFLSAFALLAGLAVMALIALENAERRAREAALLKVMGGTRGQLVRSVAAEFLLIATLACGSGWIGALVLCHGVLAPRFGIESPLVSAELGALFALLSTGVVTLGILSSIRAFRIKPIELLKSD